MTLRILGGRFRGRQIKSPRGHQTRPTSALLRKAVFDICQHRIEGARFLDLFAGSGAMGIEALSRGASHATLIEKERLALLCIRENIALLHLEEECSLLKGDALSLLSKLQSFQKAFDLIYVDPPYALSLNVDILLFLDASSLLAKGGILFIEEAIPSQLSSHPPLQHLVHKDSRKFGNSLLHQYLNPV